MINCQVKLKLTARQERVLDRWIYHLTPIWNWAIKRIERDAEIGIYYTRMSFCNILNGHGRKMGLPQDAIGGTLWTAHTAWQRCFRKVSGHPRFKGRRNRLNSIAFAHGTKVVNGHVLLPKIGFVRFHKQDVPQGHISQLRLINRIFRCTGCGSQHDRDVNAAINALIAGAGMALERKVA